MAQSGTYEQLAHLVCTDTPHEGVEHYDGTFGLEFYSSPGVQPARPPR